ncbi:MAG TPA: CRISPR-associated protein Csx19 [Candidatus Limnocylindrales bacterium]|nr:CRISPR-associated protein Csx19 [Candidatus Limnocylindrales bacterium]
MKLEIKSYPAVVQPIPTDTIQDVKAWLQTQAVQYKLKWLLAHADDGVIWGKINDNGQLVTSNGVAPEVSPPLRAETLQQARLFAEHAELLLWRDGDNRWHARLIRQPVNGETPIFTDAIDEPQMLWGTHGEHRNGFTLLRDGAQGLCHAVPMELPLGKNREANPPYLWVRHYIQEDDSGFARIVASRLVKLKNEEGPK